MRDPLVHFLVAGGLLFAAYALMGDRGRDRDTTIRIDEFEVQRLTALFHAQWQRPPSEDELAVLIADRIREEVFYREALALNLDENDVLVRRRLADKLELALVDVAAGAEPAEEALRSYYERHRARYRRPAAVTLTHRFWSAERGAIEAEAAAASALGRLQAGEPVDDDSFHAAKTLRQQDDGRLVRVFGERFTQEVLAHGERLTGAPAWFGPVPSAFGFHLVRLEAYTPSRPQPLADVHDQVIEDWRRDYVRAEEERRFRDMLGRYQVEVATLSASDPTDAVPLRQR